MIMLLVIVVGTTTLSRKVVVTETLTAKSKIVIEVEEDMDFGKIEDCHGAESCSCTHSPLLNITVRGPPLPRANVAVGPQMIFAT